MSNERISTTESFQKKSNSDDVLGSDDIVNISIVISTTEEASGKKYTASIIAPTIRELQNNTLYGFSYDSYMDAGTDVITQFTEKYPEYRWIEDNSELLNGKLA